jgi:hypothetical protein
MPLDTRIDSDVPGFAGMGLAGLGAADTVLVTASAVVAVIAVTAAARVSKDMRILLLLRVGPHIHEAADYATTATQALSLLLRGSK